MLINDEQWFNKDFLKNLSEEQAVSLIANAVYQACHLFERLEAQGKVNGNGHHMMQEISKAAGDLMSERWKR